MPSKLVGEGGVGMEGKGSWSWGGGVKDDKDGNDGKIHQHVPKIHKIHQNPPKVQQSESKN